MAKECSQLARMRIYAIGGLGADERVFQFLNLTSEIIPIRWIMPLQDESLQDYCTRLLVQIDQTQEFILMGVSFGGIVALELSQKLDGQRTIIISSVTSPDELPRGFMTIGKFMLNFIPLQIPPPMFLMNYLFGTENQKLLKEIIYDTDPKFIKWALKQIINWNFDRKIKNVTRIHGTSDKLIPLKGSAIKIEDGGHFMIVDRADELSGIINGIV